MRILALAPERNEGIYFWAVVDIHFKKLETSEANVLEALRTRPPLVGSLVLSRPIKIVVIRKNSVISG